MKMYASFSKFLKAAHVIRYHPNFHKDGSKNILCKIVFFSPQSICNRHTQVSWRMLVSICLNQNFKIN